MVGCIIISDTQVYFAINLPSCVGYEDSSFCTIGLDMVHSSAWTG